MSSPASDISLAILASVAICTLEILSRTYGKQLFSMHEDLLPTRTCMGKKLAMKSSPFNDACKIALDLTS